jgi:glycosyltransferase involved in cell wall biosynthesis
MNPSDHPFVSVLTPVYNGEAYLAECIESVLKQTYEDFEYIILNNCSTDRTLAIAQEYAAKDRRIRIHTNDSLLDIIANHNRAFGLISPDSKYCKIVSADDWLFPECLEKLVGVAQANPSVGLVGSYQLSGIVSDLRGWRVRWDGIPFPSTMVERRQVCRAQLLTGGYDTFGTPTSLLYRSDLVRKREAFYPNSTAEADTSACYQILLDGDFGFVHQVLSYERIHGKQMSEESRTLNSYHSSRLSDLTVYGPAWLTPAELESRRQDLLKSYYSFLALRLLGRTDRAFWDYHRRRLAECGYPFSRFRLISAMWSLVVEILCDPRRSIKSALGHTAT